MSDVLPESVQGAPRKTYDFIYSECKNVVFCGKFVRI